AERMPLVAVGRSIRGLEERCLRVDNVRGAYLGTRHLIELGHRRIGFIAGRHSHRDARDRLEGYTRAIEEAGIGHSPELVVQGDFSEQSGLLAMEGLFARNALFTAVVCANDQSAYGARLALFRRGVRVPDDVSLVGFDDLPGSSFALPPLTSVRQPTWEMGLAAARYALALLDDKPYQPPQFDVELVVRESTALNRHRVSAEMRSSSLVDST
ncbi:MAG TPA: substrate-binding domain-containing protein, partial [Deinococcales bacterium]|nr:substrate-binding domain-containing protein [Deinococcales bacterium]